MIKLGSNSIGQIYLGSNSIGKAYLGSNLVFQKGGGSLPYTPVDYIQTDGAAYIDTGVNGNAPCSCEVKSVMPQESHDYVLLGSRKDSGNTRFVLILQWSYSSTNKGKLGTQYGEASYVQVDDLNSIDNGTPVIIRAGLNSSYCHIEAKQSGESTFTSDTKTSITSAITTNRPLFLFTNNYGGVPSQSNMCPSGTRIYYCKIFNDINYTTLAFDGVPCVYNGEYGLWDKVSNTFFGNAAGSGAFTGPQI